MAIMVAAMLILYSSFSIAEGVNFTCPAAIFSFGDSLADTGNFASAFPAPPYIKFHSTMEKLSSGRLPYRACNGRLLIDFTAQAFKFPFLDAYFKDIDPNYQHGVNFATSSSTARNTTEASPFFLSTQISQLIKFKNDALSQSSDNSLPAKETFATGLYWISIGINDFLRGFAYSGLSLSQINATLVPQVVSFVSNAVEDLYNYAGARTFMVANVPAVGCLPSVVSSLGTGASGSTDSFGCLQALNNVVQSYNHLLKQSLQQVSQSLSDATITYGDFYGVHMDSIANPQNYGFEGSTRFLACCEDGAHYSGPAAHCSSAATTCPNPSTYISWDGIHFTEAFNKVLATSFLKGKYIDPLINLATTCSLDFTQF